MSLKGDVDTWPFFVGGGLKDRGLEDGVHLPGSPTVLRVKAPGKEATRRHITGASLSRQGKRSTRERNERRRG